MLVQVRGEGVCNAMQRGMDGPHKEGEKGLRLRAVRSSARPSDASMVKCKREGRAMAVAVHMRAWYMEKISRVVQKTRRGGVWCVWCMACMQ